MGRRATGYFSRITLADASQTSNNTASGRRILPEKGTLTSVTVSKESNTSAPVNVGAVDVSTGESGIVLPMKKWIRGNPLAEGDPSTWVGEIPLDEGGPRNFVFFFLRNDTGSEQQMRLSWVVRHG